MSLHETPAGASLTHLEQGCEKNPVSNQPAGAVPAAATVTAAARSTNVVSGGGDSVGGGNVNNEKSSPEDASRNDSNSDSYSDAPSGRLDPSDAFTHHQLFYIFVLDGIGGMLLSGGVNFALAYVMYTTQDTVKNPIRLFQLPNTLAGDAAVTIIVQCILTWFVEKGLVAYDLSRRTVQPIGFLPEPTVAWQRRLFFLDDGDNDAGKKTGVLATLAGLAQQALRGFLLAVAGFFLLWPAGVGILTAFGNHTGGDYTYRDRWTPQVFKLVLGGLLGLLTTPLMAMFWLIKAGWEAQPQVRRGAAQV